MALFPADTSLTPGSFFATRGKIGGLLFSVSTLTSTSLPPSFLTTSPGVDRNPLLSLDLESSSVTIFSKELPMLLATLLAPLLALLLLLLKLVLLLVTPAVLLLLLFPLFEV
jgi:hypothetical protein